MQFTYGDDGLHPDKMENNDRPVDFDRLRLRVHETLPCRDEKALCGEDLMKLVDQKLGEKRFQALLKSGSVFLEEVRAFFALLVDKQNELLLGSGLNTNVESRLWHGARVTETQLEIMLEKALEKCLLAYVEPGEAIGAIGAQSISEPGTQMTLKVGTRAAMMENPNGRQRSNACV